MKILVTCPPMIGVIDEFKAIFESYGAEAVAAEVLQTLTVEQLKKLVPEFDGWIIGDDPATREVFQVAKEGKLKAAVKWGIGVDNVDLKACEDLAIPIANTPNMFGAEVADLALGYIIALARQTFEIDRGIREGGWPKPQGISLSGRKAAILGFGDIGQSLAVRLKAIGMDLIVYDPYVESSLIPEEAVQLDWPERLSESDFVVSTCALTASSRHMINANTLAAMKRGVRIINVSRGGVIDEPALYDALHCGRVFSAALDVFECEPLPGDSPLRNEKKCIFGSHNASNTSDAVRRTSKIAIKKLFELIDSTK